MCVVRTLEKSTIYTEELVETSTGQVLVAHSGDRYDKITQSRPFYPGFWQD